MLLAVEYIPQSCVEAALSDIDVLRHLVVHVLLPESTTVTLFNIARSPRCVKMVNGYDALLSVHADAHLAGRAYKHSDFAVIHICKELLFLCVGVGLVDKGDFLFRNTPLDEICTHIVVELGALGVEHIVVDLLGNGFGGLALALRGSHIAEDYLCALDFVACLVLLEYIIAATVQLTARLIGE